MKNLESVEEIYNYATYFCEAKPKCILPGC